MFICLVVLVLLLGLAQIFAKLSTIRTQSDRMAHLGMKKAALVFEQEELERYKEQAATEAGQETAARRLGYVRPGERRILFSREKTGEDTDAEAAGAVPGS